MDAAFIQDRITATKAQIVAYEDAALALASGAQSYTFDDGQTRQTVTQKDLGKLQDVIDGLYNRLCTLEARLNGGVAIVRPAF